MHDVPTPRCPHSSCCPHLWPHVCRHVGPRPHFRTAACHAHPSNSPCPHLRPHVCRHGGPRPHLDRELRHVPVPQGGCACVEPWRLWLFRKVGTSVCERRSGAIASMHGLAKELLFPCGMRACHVRACLLARAMHDACARGRSSAMRAAAPGCSRPAPRPCTEISHEQTTWIILFLPCPCRRL